MAAHLRRKTEGQRPAARVTPCDTLPEGGSYLTKAEVARLLQVCLRSVTNLMHDGELPYLQLRRRIVRFQRADVERYLEENARVCHAPGQVPPASKISTL